MPEAPELSRPLVLAAVPAGGRMLVVEPSAAECAALAARMGIPAVNRLVATLALRPDTDGTVLVEGGLEAEVVQLCIVTLEPVTQQVMDQVAWRLLPEGRGAADGIDDPWDDIESVNGSVDLGEALAEQLALALDPYPRAPGAELPPEATDGPDSPFAGLAALQKKR